MDFWLIGNKAVLLFYVIAAIYFQGPSASSWDMIAYLLYVCLNVAIPIFKKSRPKRALAVVSAAFVVLLASRLDPLYFLLLPVNLYELALLAPDRSRASLATAMLALLPLFALPRSLLPLYLTAALLSYLIHASLRRHSDKLKRLEDERENLRADLERLTRSLSENKEFIRQSEYTFKLEERNRLSQRIHDEIGHSMAGALIQMEAARRLLDSNRDKAGELLGNAIAISKEGLERIRLTLKDMKPRSEELGLHRLRLFADELSAKHAVAATVTYSGDVDVITPIQWKIIQENATEAVTNSLKYGGATAIEIEVSVLNRFIKAVVADNGKGAEKIVKGLGIVGMEERTASAGGTVIVDGTRGFSVTTLLPYRRGDAPAPQG